MPHDERARAAGLAPLREEGYRRVLSQLRDLREGSGGSLLEVGSAHAWFLRAARGQFERSVGIEPDDAVRVDPKDSTIEIRAGYFPDRLVSGESFDVVAFNDVFEHIARPRTVAAAVATALKFGGIAVINVPVCTGVLYRFAKLMYSVRIRGPFERMWQKEFQSPHLYYFSERGLVTLFNHVGCNCERRIVMPTLRMRGLWSRIRYAETRLLPAILTYCFSALAAPLLCMLPADVNCFYFKKTSC